MKARLALPLVLLAAACLPACATSHLVRWSKAEKSTFSQPSQDKSVYVRAGGTVVAFPVAVAWDIVTFPFQWFWDVHPYGAELPPDADTGTR
jgi:hypothetical protein